METKAAIRHENDLNKEAISIARNLLEQAGIPARAFFDDHVRTAMALISNQHDALLAAKNALRSYQFGNASPELAEEVANYCDKVLAEYKASK